MYPKNSASPATIYAKVVAAADGAPITTGVTAYHIQATTQAAVGGTAAGHIADGIWAYTPTQAETNYAAFAIHFKHTDAVGDGPIVEIVTGPAHDGTNVQADAKKIGGQTATAAGAITVGAYVGQGTAAIAADANGRVQVQVGTGEGQINSSSGKVPATVAAADVSGNPSVTVAAWSAAAIATNITGNLSGSVGSVTGAVGSVTGAVGSVTGNVGGNVTGSVGSVTGAVGSVTGNVGGNVAGSVASVTGAVGSVTGDVGGKVLGGGAGTITGTGVRAVDGSGNAIAPAATALSNLTWTDTKAAYIDAAISSRGTGMALDAAGVRTALGLATANLDTQFTALAAYIDTEVASILEDTGTTIPAQIAALTIPSAATIADAVWDEAIAGHAAAGSTGAALSAATAPTAAAVADAVWDEALSGHAGAGSAGQALSAAGGAADPLLNTVPGTYASGSAGYALGSISTIESQTALISSAQVVVRSSWSGRGAITIYRDEDTSGSNAWTVTADASEPDFTGGTATMEVRTVEIPEGENEGTLAATFTGAVTAARTIAISATAAEKDELQVGSSVYTYKVIAITAAGVARAIAVGNVIVR